MMGESNPVNHVMAWRWQDKGCCRRRVAVLDEESRDLVALRGAASRRRWRRQSEAADRERLSGQGSRVVPFEARLVPAEKQ